MPLLNVKLTEMKVEKEKEESSSLEIVMRNRKPQSADAESKQPSDYLGISHGYVVCCGPWKRHGSKRYSNPNGTS
jgi:hypothetical protein